MPQRLAQEFVINRNIEDATPGGSIRRNARLADIQPPMMAYDRFSPPRVRTGGLFNMDVVENPPTARAMDSIEDINAPRRQERESISCTVKTSLLKQHMQMPAKCETEKTREDFSQTRQCLEMQRVK